MEEYPASPRRATFIQLDYGLQPPVHESSAASSHGDDDSPAGRTRGTRPVTTSTTKNLPKSPVKGVVRPEKASKRKPDCPSYYEPVYVESCLVQLCRGGAWFEVIHRCQIHPEEARLVPCSTEISHDGPNNNNRFHRHSTKRAVSDVIRNNDNNNNFNNTIHGQIFRETALGIACAAKESGEREVWRKEVIFALIDADPRQVGASQLISGHTPLRDAILNDCSTPEILRALAKGSLGCPNGPLAFQLLDRNGLSLADHLVMAVQLGSSQRSVEMLSEFIRIQPIEVRHLQPRISPLIRLLTLGNSFGVVQPQRRPFADEIHVSPWRKAETEDHARLKRVLAVTRYLLDDDPELLHRCSKVSGCAPLHVALRNYGSYEPLIEELLQRDPTNEVLKLRNSYGDLPIHVACSVGVPLRVLRLVVQRTTHAMQINTPGIGSHHPLLWSVNQSGYTPVDLEWVRHIESGDGFYTARSFYPLEATGVRRHCFKQDEFYQGLLREAVNHVMESDKNESILVSTSTTNREDEARAVFGCLMDRISLLVQASSTGLLPTSLSEPAHLVDTCKLSTPYGPSLPLPIMELFLWLRPDEVVKVDRDGFLPIHHALHRTQKMVSISLATPRVVQDWQAFVIRLIDTHPEQCKQKCRLGRLPLHYLLDHHTAVDGNRTSSSTLQTARHVMVEKLVEHHPESLDQRDPVTGFYPFMMAAKDQNLSLDTVFCLLRRSPARCVVETPSDA